MSTALLHAQGLKTPLTAGIHGLKFGFYVLGCLCIGLAVTAYFTQWQLVAIFAWLRNVFGLGFVVFYGLLAGVALYAARCLSVPEANRFWYETGMQATSGIATLALTFTLLGISLGIGALADQNITPDSIQSIIQDLTLNFSTAFMTSVVGLPTASILRAYLSLKQVRVAETSRATETSRAH